MNEYYVYEHWRPDTGVCFYVGKGKGKRAWDMKHMRNRHHMAIVSKLTSVGLLVDVKIIASGMSSEDALKLEIERISFYGVDSLSNMTGGGDGLSSPTQETRLKISASQKKRFENHEEKEKMIARLKGRIPWNKGLKTKGTKHSDAAKEKIRIAAKKRGIPEKVRAAQKAAVTGRKRAPFSAETIRKMSEAAKAREARKRQERAA